MNNINTQVVQEYLQKGNRILYLALKKKPDSQEVVEELIKELKENLDIFLQNIYPKIKDQKFDDFEKSFKLILIKGLIQILEKMLTKYYGQLVDEDKKLIEQILKEEKLPPISENNQENPP
jgi:predicted site-specific integrase-resolvase